MQSSSVTSENCDFVLLYLEDLLGFVGLSVPPVRSVGRRRRRFRLDFSIGVTVTVMTTHERGDEGFDRRQCDFFGWTNELWGNPD